MANTLGVYDPIFYAQEALIQLEKALGMASRVHLGYDEERRSFRKGQVVSIRRPSVFTVGDAPATAQDITTETVNINLNKWREVKFKLTDRELAFTGQRIIDDHIRPAAVAIADDIDQKLNELAMDIPWFVTMTDPAVVADVTTVHQTLFDNKVPMTEGMVHHEINGKLQNQLLQLSAFAQQQGAGAIGVATQLRGSLAVRYGQEFYANQNVATRTSGTLSALDPLLKGAGTIGQTTCILDKATLTGTLLQGDSFVLAGSTQRYAVTADATAAANEISVTITPGFVIAYADNAAGTVDLQGGAGTTLNQNVAHHRNAFALVTAPLSEMGNELGARIATIQDPITGLSLRSRLYYVGNSSEVHVALDVLYGVKTLDPNLAAISRHAV